MSEIVNLKRARKARARAAAEADAQTKRVAHGRSKIEKSLSKAEKNAAHRKLDGHKRSPNGAGDND